MLLKPNSDLQWEGGSIIFSGTGKLSGKLSSFGILDRAGSGLPAKDCLLLLQREAIRKREREREGHGEGTWY